MRRGLRSTSLIFAQSQSFVGSRPDCAGAKFALSSNSSASTRNPKFIAGFFYSSPSFSSSTLRGPNLLSWFVIFAVAVETLHYRLDRERFGVADSSVSPLHLRRPDALFIARRGR